VYKRQAARGGACCLLEGAEAPATPTERARRLAVTDRSE
jgi:hypothetical protein